MIRPNRKTLAISMFVMLIMPLTLILACSCSKSENDTAVFLEYSNPDPARTMATIGIFDETNCHVLRCVSLTENNHGITATVTRTKAAKIKSLIFVNLAEGQNSSDVEIACVITIGDEGDYDISRAFYRTIKPGSAIEAVESYGLAYEDWLTGTMSESELFPCCQ